MESLDLIQGQNKEKKDPEFESSQSKPPDSDGLGGLWLHPSHLPCPENVKVLNLRKKENKH